MKTICQRNLLPSLMGGAWRWVFCLALTLVVGGCSKDNDDPESGDSTVLLQEGTDSRPTTWVLPDASLYELRMSVQVELGDTLANFQSSEDLMCAKINGQVRAVTSPCTTGGVIYYPLIILDDGQGGMVSLFYYCDCLHHIFTIGEWASFNSSAAPTGNSGIYRPCFTQE